MNLKRLLNEAWSEEARQAAMEARKGSSKAGKGKTPSGKSKDSVKDPYDIPPDTAEAWQEAAEEVTGTVKIKDHEGKELTAPESAPGSDEEGMEAIRQSYIESNAAFDKWDNNRKTTPEDDAELEAALQKNQDVWSKVKGPITRVDLSHCDKIHTDMDEVTGDWVGSSKAFKLNEKDPPPYFVVADSGMDEEYSRWSLVSNDDTFIVYQAPKDNRRLLFNKYMPAKNE